jgi:hypothetical protein
MSLGDAMGVGMEPEPEPVAGGFSAEQKVDNFFKSKTKDHKETSAQGLRGPDLQAQLLKRSDHIKEWRSRYFHLHDRRIYYFVSRRDGLPPAPLSPLHTHTHTHTHTHAHAPVARGLAAAAVVLSAARLVAA